MKSKKTLNKIKTLLGMEVNFEQMKLKDGAILEADSFEVGSEVFIIVEDEKVKAPIGEHELEDGSMLIIEEEGIIKEIKSSEEEESKDEVEEESLEEKEKDEELSEEKEEEELSKFVTVEAFEEAVKEMKEMIMTYVEEKEKEKEKEELSSQEEVKPLTHSPESEVKTKVKITGFSENRVRTTSDRVTSQIYNIKKNK